MPAIVNVDGELVEPGRARVSAFDHGFLYGDSVYETLRAYGGGCFLLREHLERLERSAAAIDLAPPLAPKELGAEIARTLAASGEAEAALRVVFTRGEGALGIDPGLCPRPSYLVYVRPFTPLPPENYQQGVACVLAQRPRNSVRALDPAIKSGNFLNNILAAGEARSAGAFEAILVNHDALVAEATQSNVFLVIGGELVTPALSAGLLAGITRQLVFSLARREGLVAHERDTFVAELYEADELLLTSTLKEIVPVTRLGKRAVGEGRPGPLCGRLRELYALEVERFRRGAAAGPAPA